MDYDSKVFSINEDYGLDHIRFNQIFCREIKWKEHQKEEEFKSIIKNNKIDLANDPKFNDFIWEKKDKIWEFIIYSIKLDNFEFVNIILQNSGIELSKFPIIDIIRLYKEVRIVSRS
jgi:hypothetical protein